MGCFCDERFVKLISRSFHACAYTGVGVETNYGSVFDIATIGLKSGALQITISLRVM